MGNWCVNGAFAMLDYPRAFQQTTFPLFDLSLTCQSHISVDSNIQKTLLTSSKLPKWDDPMQLDTKDLQDLRHALTTSYRLGAQL